MYNYAKLYDLAKDKGIDTDGAEKSTEIIFAQDNTPSAQSEEFTEEDKAKADSLPQQLTGEYYVSVTSLLDKLENSPDFEGKEKYLEKLKKAREEISRIRAEVESINNEITDKLYPFEDMGLSDRKTVENIVKRCEKLSDYDRGQIKRYEDVIKTQTKLDNRLRGIIIGCCLGAAAAALAVATIFRIRKRRARAENEMEQLAAMYKDEE